MSENDEGFEVTMTATADADLSEEGVAQIQVLFFCFPVLIASAPLNFRSSHKSASEELLCRCSETHQTTIKNVIN